MADGDHGPAARRPPAGVPGRGARPGRVDGRLRGAGAHRLRAEVVARGGPAVRGGGVRGGVPDGAARAGVERAGAGGQHAGAAPGRGGALVVRSRAATRWRSAATPTNRAASATASPRRRRWSRAAASARAGLPMTSGAADVALSTGPIAPARAAHPTTSGAADPSAENRTDRTRRSATRRSSLRCERPVRTRQLGLGARKQPWTRTQPLPCPQTSLGQHPDLPRRNNNGPHPGPTRPRHRPSATVT